MNPAELVGGERGLEGGVEVAVAIQDRQVLDRSSGLDYRLRHGRPVLVGSRARRKRGPGGPLRLAKPASGPLMAPAPASATPARTARHGSGRRAFGETARYPGAEQRQPLGH